MDAVYKNLKSLFAAPLIAAVFFCAACSQPVMVEEEKEEAWEEPADAGGAPSDPRYTLDPKLQGIWEFDWSNGQGSGVERVTVTGKSNGLGTIEYAGGWSGSDGSYAGDIVGVKRFSDSAGILIVEFWPGREITWMSLATGANGWQWQKHPLGYRFYGVYYINLEGGSPGSKCFFANTNDQNPNAPWGQYGPTETQTLEQAKAKFTQGSMPNLLALDVGDPQIKQ